MIGRSSRTRSVCDSVMYVQGEEKQNQVMDKLRKQNVAAMQDLEKLIKLLEKKEKSEFLVKTL
jgi:hypothetical protein